MALTGKNYEAFYVTTGSGADKVATKNLTDVTAAWAAQKGSGSVKYLADPILAPLVFQLQQMQDEIDYLRTEISSNKDKTGISSGQTSAITANTAKVSLAGGSATTLSFGEMITVPPKVKGGKDTYYIIMTATKGGVATTVQLTLT